jgi:hypothetical protein
MFSLITNIYNKKTKGPAFSCHRKTEKVFFDNKRFLMCAPRVTAHIDTIFKFLQYTRQHGCIDILPCCYDPRRSRMVLSVDGSFAYFARNALCTVTKDLLVWYSNTQNDFSPRVAIFSLRTLASPSSRNVNYDETQLTGKKIFSVVPSICTGFCIYVSYGFLIINVCNPGVYYEMPCIFPHCELWLV